MNKVLHICATFIVKERIIMPATYAHYRFGRHMLNILSERLSSAAEDYPSLFLTGAQGPDLMFFYRPLKYNDVNKVGYDLHDESGKLFFSNARNLVSDSPKRRDFKAYVLGLLCHYALDKACHGYIENKIRISKVSHSEIEKEFDKHLIRLDGENPFKFDLSCGVEKDEKNAAAIVPFFNNLKGDFKKITLEDVLGALGGFRKYNRLMQGRTAAGRVALSAALRLSGKYEKLHVLFYSHTDIAACEDSNMRLEKLFERAKASCLSLISEFFECAHADRALGDDFAPTFGPCDGWQDIPVLTPEEEKEYEI